MMWCKILKMWRIVVLLLASFTLLCSCQPEGRSEPGREGSRHPGQEKSLRNGPESSHDRARGPGPHRRPDGTEAVPQDNGHPSIKRGNTSTLVHLFEWKWSDIADECERFLAPKGYGGVQISPPSENVVITSPFRPWWERYQVVSYILTTRSGNEEQLVDMSRRCNRVGVRIFADIVVNHMTGNVPNDIGTAGSQFNASEYEYSQVPFTSEDFHTPCAIDSYQNSTEVRVCQLVGLKDLDQSKPYVRDKIVDYMNHLIRLGIAGFRIDAAKHMSPSDLEVIYNRLDNLSTEFGFLPNTRPYIFQEVIDYGGEAVNRIEYTPLGAVTEFKFGFELGKAFSGNNPLKWLRSWGPEWSLLPSDVALVFVDNHDNQRGHGGGSNGVLTHKNPKPYKTAVAFMLAHPYGRPRVMSSYFFETSDQGPPASPEGNITSPTINEDVTCGNRWVCEHRWREIYQMVIFRNRVFGTDVEEWWDNGNNQVAFSRGDKGFIAINIENSDLNEKIRTKLPEGKYCDVVSGEISRNGCTGKEVYVDSEGYAQILITRDAFDQFMAIHVGPQSRMQDNSD